MEKGDKALLIEVEDGRITWTRRWNSLLCMDMQAGILLIGKIYLYKNKIRNYQSKRLFFVRKQFLAFKYRNIVYKYRWGMEKLVSEKMYTLYDRTV